MNTSEQQAYNEIQKLVSDFKANEQYYLSSNYQEKEVRSDFIDKFFIALGWDVLHNEQKNPYEQEVKVEKGVSVSGAQKRADYSFSLSPNFRDPKFLVEAKKPAKDLKNTDYYFQTIRYGWHKATPLAVLTDFEEFHILDCRYTPDINNALNKCYKHFHYADYTDKEKFGELYWLFSREAVADNSIEKVADALPKRKGKKITKTEIHAESQTIDEAFLEEIDEIREKLAKAFKKNNEELSSGELTEATQITIDRLVFIRFLEDKLIEQEYYVSRFGEKGNAWEKFINTCKRLNAKYNGVVFKKSLTIDSPSFKGADEKEFAEICNKINHKNSRFLYNEIPIHILGSIYERFLGKEVRATDHRVKIEEKPEVRKAGGVYYTPKYIVDYIVKNTIGKLIEGRTPNQISKMRFADIACGSGSFLIGAFGYLLDYHTKWYNQNPEQAIKDNCIYNKLAYILHQKDKSELQYSLSIRQKQKILLNNIFGVDIDYQAVEVTQLSLSLKMLEDETTSTANDMQVLFHEKILPDLSKNIICGNSLIGMDIETPELFSNTEELIKINPMDFETEFREVFKSKIEKEIVFTPDIGIDEVQEANPGLFNEPIKLYEKTITGGFDAIIGNPPYVQPIVLDKNSQTYLLNKYRANSDLYSIFIERGLNLLHNSNLLGFIVPSLFLKGVRYNSLRKLINSNCIKVDIKEYGDGVFDKVKMPTCIVILQKGNPKKEQNYFANKNHELFQKVDTVKLDEISVIRRGLEIGKDKLLSEPNNNICITGSNLDCYSIKSLNYISEESLKLFAKNSEIISLPKIMVRETGNKFFASIDYSGILTTRSIYNTKILNNNYPPEYILGIISSNLFKFYFRQFISPETKIFPKIRIAQLKEIPIPKSIDRILIEKMVKLVEKMLQATKQLQSAKTINDKTNSERNCANLDIQIDNLVYELYGLTKEEIEIVEKN